MSASLHIVKKKTGEYTLELEDGIGSMRLATFNSPMAMGMFCDLVAQGIVPAKVVAE